ncbi:MAG: TetR/AcrR family transcriptional regulator [Sciscionella sp.]
MYHMVQRRTTDSRESGGAGETLLAAAVDHVAANGVGDFSLRQLAAALGTSHRMLIYHFGSKEGLLVAVVRMVEQRQRDVLAALGADPANSAEEAGRRFWRDVSDPALQAHERLFFELYGRALQGYPGTTELLDGIVESWLEPLAALLRRYGFAEERARVQARLAIAVGRGLLLDLLATGERERVNESMEMFLSMVAAS